MLSTPLTVCSSGVATDCSIVTASAPVKTVDTWISGGTMLGYWAMGSRVTATAPTRIVMSAMTIAMTGRLMKKRPMVRHFAGGGAAEGAADAGGPPPTAGGGGGGGVGTGTGTVDIGRAEVSAGVGATGWPARTFCTPSMTIRSPTS